jgi:hypothetical protein
VVLPGLNGAFGGIALMDMWRHHLEGDVMFCECFFHFVGAFIVKHMEMRGKTVARSFKWSSVQVVVISRACRVFST